MGLFNRFATEVTSFQGFVGINRLPHSRVRLLYTWLRLRLKSKFGSGAKSEHVLGYKVQTPDRTALAYLFIEVFVVQEYAFAGTNMSPYILDLGGNIGMATLFFKRIYPDATIEAYEPGPDTFRLLEANVRNNNLTNVTVHNEAVAGEDGTLEFFTDTTKGASMIASIRPERSVQWVEGEAVKKEKVSVKAVRLSERIDREVDFLKMDIEGAEQQVMEELARSGKLRFVRAMVIEYHHHIVKGEDTLSKFLRILEENGFGYHIRAPFRDLNLRDEFQDILIAAYRRGER